MKADAVIPEFVHTEISGSLLARKVILEVRNVSKEFPGAKTMNTVSFRVIEGVVHNLIGHNGYIF
jgi:ABC-type uncharacterized transport system ATPase subunit